MDARTTASRVALALATLLASTAAHADPKDDARRHFSEGLAAAGDPIEVDGRVVGYTEIDLDPRNNVLAHATAEYRAEPPEELQDLSRGSDEAW